MGWLKDVLSRPFPNMHTRLHWIRMATPPKEAPEIFYVSDQRPAKGYNSGASLLFLVFPLPQPSPSLGPGPNPYLGDALMNDQSAKVNSICPWCGTEHDRALNTGPDFATPQPGDCTICITCGQASVWSETLTLRRPTKIETSLLDNDQRIQKARLVWEKMREKFRR